MNYELAKQLKEAGFPGAEHWCIYHEWNDHHDECDYYPTLTELIEACMINDYCFEMGGRSHWWAIVRDKNNQKAIVSVQDAPTPEEAVAKLWLVLNKKD